MKIFKSFKFDAAHKLTLPYESKCNNLHGHTYKLEIGIEGQINETGMVLDFKELKEMINPIIEKYDHSFLNNFFDQPTAENMVEKIWSDIEYCLYDYGYRSVNLICVRLWETETSYAEKTE